jgi:hypothetical protein
MTIKSLLAGAALLLGTSASNAGVVYEWVTVQNSMQVSSIRMRIEIEEALVRGGSFSLGIDPGVPDIPKTGLVRFDFFDSSASPLPYGWNPTDYGYLYMDLAFVHNNFLLVGSIRANDFTTRIDTGSTSWNNPDPYLWTINQLVGDGVLGCSFEPQGFCKGGTGYFRQVPEPASLGLFAIAALALTAARRRTPRRSAVS